MNFKQVQGKTCSDGSVAVSNETKKVVLQDGSIHNLPVIDTLGLQYFFERRNRNDAYFSTAGSSSRDLQQLNNLPCTEASASPACPIPSLRQLILLTEDKESLIDFLRCKQLLSSQMT